MEHHKFIMAASLVAGLLLAACSDDVANEAATGDIERIESSEPDLESDPEPGLEADREPIDEPEPEPEPDPVEVDIAVVPDEITEEYVEAVFVELERLYAEAVVEMRRNNGELNIEVTDRLGEIFDNEALNQNIEIFQAAAADGFSGVREASHINPRVRRVVKIISADPECVYAETSVDPSPIIIESESEVVNFVQLVPKVIERPVKLNDSPWVFARVTTPFDPVDRGDIAENDPCVL